MPDQIATHAVVIGAGMGGLAAAGALAGHFERVTVFERDGLPSGTEPRIGAPQGRHVHALLAGGLRALDEIFPGLGDALVAAGAVPTRANADLRFEAPGHDPYPQRDFGWTSLCLSRPLLELVVRQKAIAAGVRIADRRRVRRLETTPDGSAIVAVHVEGGEGGVERVPADLVIDASGRATPTLDLLKELGRSAPEEIIVGVDLSYGTAVFEIPADAPDDWKVVMTQPRQPESTRGGILAPLERGRWIISVGGRQDDAPPGDWAGFMDFLKGLRTPTIYDAVKDAKRVGEVVRYGFRESVWRRFDLQSSLPRGLIPFADSICRFNPVYGQGMSVAAQEASLLSHLLAQRAKAGAPVGEIGREFLCAAPVVIEGPWTMSAIPDFANPLTRGERPADLESTFRFALAFAELAARDPALHKLDAEVRALLKPLSALHEPEIVERVMDAVAGV